MVFKVIPDKALAVVEMVFPPNVALLRPVSAKTAEPSLKAIVLLPLPPALVHK
jgi:hypothetical protein